MKSDPRSKVELTLTTFIPRARTSSTKRSGSATLGEAIVRRSYGDFSIPHLHVWEKQIAELPERVRYN